MTMTELDRQALRNTADRDWFESWFKSEFHPDKTGPYIKNQLFFAVQAARKPLLDELEADKEQIKTLESRNRRLDGIISAAERRIQELEARTVTVKLPESVIDAICLTAAEIHNLGRGVSDERAQEIINSIRCAAGINLTVEG